MKIIFEDNTLILRVEDILERLYLERLGLKYKGDVAKCVVIYTGSYTAIYIEKAKAIRETKSVGDEVKEEMRMTVSEAYELSTLLVRLRYKVRIEYEEPSSSILPSYAKVIVEGIEK